MSLSSPGDVRGLCYHFLGPHLVLHGEMFMKSPHKSKDNITKSSERKKKHHTIYKSPLKKIENSQNIPWPIPNINLPWFVLALFPIPSPQVTRLTLTSSGQERGAAEEDEEDDGPRAADRRREVQEELERAFDLGQRLNPWLVDD